jgi:hypothetical protein
MIVIVGAGLAGLAAACTLKKQGRPFVVLEATDRPGGRARTFRVQPLGGLDRGYVLDRGFQVVLEAYPAVREFFDVEALAPRYFTSGAILATEGGFFRFLNPLRFPQEAAVGLLSPAFSVGDKVRLAALGLRLLGASVSGLQAQAGRAGELSTREYLQKWGFSEESVRQFFRPFFGGVLLDPTLATSSGLFLFYFQQFLRGRVFVPEAGIGALGQQLTRNFSREDIQYDATVIRIRWQGEKAVAVQLADGREIGLEGLILATEEPTTKALLPDRPAPRAGRPVWTFYFATRRPLYSGSMLVLNGLGGPIAHLTQLTNLNRAWAPEGQELLSVTVNDTGGLTGEALQKAVAANLRRLFPGAGALELVGEAVIPYAVPGQEAGFAEKISSARVGENVWLAGDQVAGASLQGALASGKAAALSASERPRSRAAAS